MVRIALGQINMTVGDLDGNPSKMAEWADRCSYVKCQAVASPMVATTDSGETVIVSFSRRMLNTVRARPLLVIERTRVRDSGDPETSPPSPSRTPPAG